jgi:LPXTG-motif cell wall-anchored protein
MKKVRWLSAAAGTAIVAVSLAMPTAAYAAAPSGNTTGLGNLSLLNGNGINLPVSLPIDLCGVGAGVLGGAEAGCQGGASSNTIVDPSGGSARGSAGGSSGSGDTSGVGNITAVNGNTINAPVSAPISLCGVSGAVAGSASSHCVGGSHASTAIVGSGGGGNNGDTSGVGNVSAVNGNTINAPISAPIDACSISLAILGLANSGCAGGATTDSTIVGSGGAGGNNGNVTGIGNLSAVDGNTINAPISIPISVCSVSLAVLGEANSGCRGGATTTTTIITPQPPTCRDANCAPPTCHSRDCIPPVCHGTHCTTPVCHSRDCTTPVCHSRDCTTPVCHRTHCTTPVCHRTHCTTPVCHRTHCTTPPGCVGHTCTVVPPTGGTHHRHPGGVIPGITTSGGSGPGLGNNASSSGSTNVTSATTTSMSGNLPTTGADLAMVAAVAFGSIAAGTGAVVFARRRRSNQASQAEVSQAA